MRTHREIQPLTAEQNALVLEHLKLPAAFVARYGRDLRDDLAQEASLGLIHAARKYRPESGPFVPYARRWMCRYVLRAAGKSLAPGRRLNVDLDTFAFAPGA